MYVIWAHRIWIRLQGKLFVDCKLQTPGKALKMELMLIDEQRLEGKRKSRGLHAVEGTGRNSSLGGYLGG